MKKIICCCLVCILCLFSACTDNSESQLRDWSEDFTVSCKYVPDSYFDDPIDELDALLNGTFIFEHDEYTITNNTNESFQKVYLVFEIRPTGKEPIEYKKYLIANMEPGQTVIDEITYNSCELELASREVSYEDGYKVYLVRIEYEVKETD